LWLRQAKRQSKQSKAMVEEDLSRWLDFKANAYPFENLTREQELKYIKLICEASFNLL